MGNVSLARALSKLGVCSRSAGEALVRGGRVTVDGRVVHDPGLRVDPDRTRLAVDGQPVAAARHVYLMLNKPRGLVTTADDEKGRDTVYRCLPADLPWVGPVGRLDKASEGLLLFSNDSRWAARITDPQSRIEKVYHVQVDRPHDPALPPRLAQGLTTASGEYPGVVRATLLRAGTRTSWLEVVLDEGRNRQIRRLLEAFGVGVLRLVRVAIGPLALGTLPKGAHRALEPQEVAALEAAAVPPRERGRQPGSEAVAASSRAR
jgi:23S rRNA pseudouridine2605 synthase